jgi:hypothetical protein
MEIEKRNSREEFLKEFDKERFGQRTLKKIIFSKLVPRILIFLLKSSHYLQKENNQ